MKIVTVDQMREMERRSEEHGVSVDTLMENAGLEVARRAAALLPKVANAQVLVLVGPGNNGGDGLVAARHLHDWGARVTLYLCADRPGVPAKLQLCQDRRIPTERAQEDSHQERLRHLLDEAQLVVDAVLGTGRVRPIEGMLKDVLTTLNDVRAQRRAPTLLALDLPTGLNADTGEVDPVCPRADVTVTLGAPKRGLFLFPGAEHVGRLEIADIGVPLGLDTEADLDLLDAALVRRLLPPRPLAGHKGTFGRVLVVAGSRSYVGAAVLACRGAYRSGAGLVTLAAPEGVYRLVAPQATEVIHLPLPETSDGTVSPSGAEAVLKAMMSNDVLLMGCGMAQTDATRQFVAQVLLSGPLAAPAVLDADALNNLATVYRWWERLEGKAVLTPHPGEMARLVSRPVADVQKDRVSVAREAARLWGQAVALKGAFTVVASPDGPTRLSPYANPALGSGGTGDVLSGVIAGLVAQGLSPFEAACAGVHLHAVAGEQWSQHHGSAGLLAGELLAQVPLAMKSLREST